MASTGALIVTATLRKSSATTRSPAWISRAATTTRAVPSCWRNAANESTTPTTPVTTITRWPRETRPASLRAADPGLTTATPAAGAAVTGGADGTLG